MIFGKLKLYAVIAAIGTAFMAALVAIGQSMQKTKQVKRDHKDYVDTRENIEDEQADAAEFTPSEWLRDRKSDRDLR